MKMNEKMTKVYDEMYDYVLYTARPEMTENEIDCMANDWMRSHNKEENYGFTDEEMNYMINKCVKEYIES